MKIFQYNEKSSSFYPLILFSKVHRKSVYKSSQKNHSQKVYTNKGETKL